MLFYFSSFLKSIQYVFWFLLQKTMYVNMIYIYNCCKFIKYKVRWQYHKTVESLNDIPISLADMLTWPLRTCSTVLTTRTFSTSPFRLWQISRNTSCSSSKCSCCSLDFSPPENSATCRSRLHMTFLAFPSFNNSAVLSFRIWRSFIVCSTLLSSVSLTNTSCSDGCINTWMSSFSSWINTFRKKSSTRNNYVYAQINRTSQKMNNSSCLYTYSSISQVRWVKLTMQ